MVTKSITFKISFNDLPSISFSIPAKWKICPMCMGEGTIDIANEGKLRNIMCGTCYGRRVIFVPDESNIDKLLQEQQIAIEIYLLLTNYSNLHKLEEKHG